MSRRLPRLHAVTDDEVLASAGWRRRAIAVLEAGGPEVALHLRGRTTCARALAELADSLAPHVRHAEAALLVNDRVDVALVTEVAGVHLGGGSLPLPEARELLGPERWIGASCHGTAEVTAAAEQGADYVFLGTIYPTPSHPGVPGSGTHGIREALESSDRVCLIGIGGIGPSEAAAVVAAGAHGVAAIRGIWSARDPGLAVRQYLDALGD